MPDPTIGRDDYVEVCHYDISFGWPMGFTTLTFVAKTVSGYKPLEQDKTGVLGAITPLTLTAIPKPMTLSLLALGGVVAVRRRVTG